MSDQTHAAPQPHPSFYLCEDTGQQVDGSGACPVHGGDRCIARYDHHHRTVLEQTRHPDTSVAPRGRQEHALTLVRAWLAGVGRDGLSAAELGLLSIVDHALTAPAAETPHDRR